MDSALQALLIPAARALGFEGKLPHVLRKNVVGIAVLSVQKEKWGGGVRLELGFVPAWLRVLRPRAYPNRARAGARGPGLTAYHAPMSYRRELTGRLAEKERLTPLRDTSPFGRTVLERAKTSDLALDWLLSAKSMASLRSSLQGLFVGPNRQRPRCSPPGPWRRLVTSALMRFSSPRSTRDPRRPPC
jgi:hypothetical protein